MPFRARFDCLWCGTRHVTRTPQDLEGWASLCPTCIGRAGDNGFLRTRLRAALAERSRSAEERAGEERAAEERWAEAPGPAETPGPAGAPSPVSDDDFYRRSGRFSAGAIQDGAWQMELDAVTAWLDGLPLGPVIAELGAGGGWWSALLATKAELWAYDPIDDALERMRQRLVAHGLRAHLHRREIDAPADRVVDTVFAAFSLGSTADDAALDRRLEAIASWLRPGGTFVFIEAPSVGDGRTVDGPHGLLRALDWAALETRLGRHRFRVSATAPGGRSFIGGVASLVGSASDAPVAPVDAPMSATSR